VVFLVLFFTLFCLAAAPLAMTQAFLAYARRRQ
jgi:hypothetical protein